MIVSLWQKVLLKKTDGTNSNGIFPIFIKSLTLTALTLKVYSSMKIFILKVLIQNKSGLSVDQQTLLFAGRRLEDDRTLGDYNISMKSTIHLVLNLRGGMYHFTSGRQGFDCLPYDGAKAIQNVLEFKIKNMNQISLLSSVELQNYVLQAQDVLLNLYNSIEKIVIPSDVPNLMADILSIATDSEDDDDKSDD